LMTLCLTAVKSARRQEIDPEKALQFHRAADAVPAPVQVPETVQPFDHQSQQDQQPTHHHAVGLMVEDQSASNTSPFAG
ncbi:MAG: hypothetical protein AAB225_14845, partial [Acidobacteriota bacterium]